jgi:hypothetical protein
MSEACPLQDCDCRSIGDDDLIDGRLMVIGRASHPLILDLGFRLYDRQSGHMLLIYVRVIMPLTGTLQSVQFYFLVTSSSAPVRWIATQRSMSALGAPVFTATPNSYRISSDLGQ